MNATSKQRFADLIWCELLQIKGWRMVKSETRRDAEILVRNLSSRLFGKKFRDSKKVKANYEKTRLRDLSSFWDFEILPKFSKTHVFWGTIRHP